MSNCSNAALFDIYIQPHVSYYRVAYVLRWNSARFCLINLKPPSSQHKVDYCNYMLLQWWLSHLFSHGWYCKELRHMSHVSRFTVHLKDESKKNPEAHSSGARCNLQVEHFQRHCGSPSPQNLVLSYSLPFLAVHRNYSKLRLANSVITNVIFLCDQL